MEKQVQDTKDINGEEEVKPIVFPDGSIELHHSEITLTTCSLFISIKIHHQEGFYYEMYFRDSKYKVIKSRIIESYECSIEKENEIIWQLDDVAPGTEYNVNGISKAPSGELKPLCLTFKLTSPCTRPGYSPLLLKSKSRKDIALKWKVPRENGQPIEGYSILMSDGFLSVPEEVELPFTLVEKAKVKDCKATKLKSGYFYAFQITSYNACGETVNPIQWFQTQASVPIAPEAPVSSSITCDSITLEWRDLTQEECNGSALQNYFLQMSEANQGWSAVYSDRKPMTTLSNLKYRTSYSFRLAAHNAEGDKFLNEQTTAIGKPPAPCVDPVQSSKRQGKTVMSFSWECDKESKDIVDTYFVQIEKEGNHAFVIEQECESSPYSVSSLLPGCRYLFRVKCHSPGGWSDLSKPLLFTTPSAVPSLLSSPSIQTTITSPFAKGNPAYSMNATIQWEKGEANGETIDFYTVEMKSMDPEKEQALIDSMHTLSTHPPAVNYAVEVGQYCSVLHSSDHYWIYSVNENTVRLLIADAEQKQYKIVDKEAIIIDPYSFTGVSKQYAIPEFDLLSSYALNPAVYSPLCSKWTSIQEVSSTTTSIHSLLPNSSYCLHVLPHNACGLAVNYVDTMFTTLPGPLPQPRSPNVLSVSATAIELECSQEQYEYRGNDPASIEYLVECDRSHTGDYECVYRGKQSKVTITGLQSGSVYHIRIALLSPYGNSPFSPSLSIPTKPSSPESPEHIRLGKLDALYNPLTFAFIEWAPPCVDNGSEVLQYYIELASIRKDSKPQFTQVGITKDCSFLLHDLAPGGRYAVRLQCDNKYGMSNVSPVFHFTTGCLPPDPMDPPILARKPTEKSATIRWSEPTSNGSSILGYRIHVEPINRDYNVLSDVKSQVISKLNGNTEYSVTIVAINSAGESPASEPLIFTTDAHSITAPSMTSFKPIQRSENRIMLEWEEAADNGATIQKYQLFENNSILYEGLDRCYRFTAEFGKQYAFQVRAVNVVGAGDLSEVCVVYIPVPVVEKKVVKTKTQRVPKTKAHGYENVKNDRVEAILERNNKKRFAKLQQWWREYRILIFIVAFIWISIQLFKPVKYMCLLNSPSIL